MPPCSFPSASSVVLSLLAVALLGACGSSGPQIVEESPLVVEKKPNGIVLLPVALAIPDATALEVIARTGDIARWLLQRTDLPVVGPFDYTLYKSLDEARTVSSDTDLLNRRDDVGVDVRNYLTLHVLVTENRAMNTRDITDVRQKDPKKQKTFRQRDFDSKIRVEATVYDAMRGRRLAHVAIEADDDPTEFEQGGDPRPGVTRVIGLALDHLVRTSAENLLGIGSRRTRGDGLLDSVPLMAVWGVADLPSFATQHAGDEEIVREAAELALWDRFGPGLSVRDIRAGARNPGVLVRTPLAPLESGDVVLKVAGKDVFTAYQFDRRLDACATQGCAVLVFRGGQQRELIVNWPVLRPAVLPEE